MSAITAHVLDTMSGRPAQDLRVQVFRADNVNNAIAYANTNINGRVSQWSAALNAVETGTYIIKFDTGVYFARRGIDTLYPYVDIAVNIRAGQHYHIPLLLSPFGFTTYRGS
ncbi:transthyretin [Schizosaccharomyces japonicus yFS275]|uniref:5-hydroxyisourate hydrolase n=1 Tax=Schizosaccharomyces japonicus (strain yFS275 / FY16936) TaxID=402676 RepID=B6K6G9_SCHJY|nr:transthyretin [Schizosaccharomyces japonicus yFS275]EEB09123.1 transthyretin [Schizosaccharomyces japonicus yFS275]